MLKYLKFVPSDQTVKVMWGKFKQIYRIGQNKIMHLPLD